MTPHFLVALAIISLAGCSGGTFIDDTEGQSGQGKDRLEMEWCESDTEGADRYLCRVTVDIGRDKDSIGVDLTRPDGTVVHYSAGRATGAEQARIRGEVERRLGEVQGEITPDIVRGIVDTVLGL